MATFCCAQCRLLQDPTSQCAECGSEMVAPLPLVRELLCYRDLNVASGRDWAFITAMIAGGSIAFPVLAPVAFGSLIALGVSKLRGLRKRRAITGVQPWQPAAHEGATTLYGSVRPFHDSVALLDGPPALLQHVAVRDRDGGVLIRRSAGAAFWLDGENGEQVLIAGAASIAGARHIDRVRTGDVRLARLGVPADFAIAGELAIDTIASGTTVVVTGMLGDESVSELAFHRDGGRVAVMRGVPGAPVVVSSQI